MAVNMYYSSESSDSENTAEVNSLDYSYLMLDTDSLAVHLRNSIREQCVQQGRCTKEGCTKEGRCTREGECTTGKRCTTENRIAGDGDRDLRDLGLRDGDRNLGSRGGVRDLREGDRSLGDTGGDRDFGDRDDDKEFGDGDLRDRVRNSDSSDSERRNNGDRSSSSDRDSVGNREDGDIGIRNRLDSDRDDMGKDGVRNRENGDRGVRDREDSVRNRDGSDRGIRDREREREDEGHDTITQKLLLQHNMLLTIPFEIVKFTKLKMLDLSSNNLTHINDFILHLPLLQSLYLQNNSLADDGLPKDLSTLSCIRELNLSGNKFTRMPPQLYEMSSLRYLYLGSNLITEVLPEIKAMQSLQVLHLGGNQLETVPDELGELHHLGALVLCDNRLSNLPRAISNLTRLRSLLLHKNDLCSLPVGIVKLRGLMELSLRDNPLVTRFVNSCARELMYNPPSLLELAARVIKLKRVAYTTSDLPHTLVTYLGNGQRCVNPKCKGMYFTSCVEHIKFVDFCGAYRVPLMHYLCSSRCSSKTPDYYRATSESESEEDEPPTARLKRVLLG